MSFSMNEEPRKLPRFLLALALSAVVHGAWAQDDADTDSDNAQNTEDPNDTDLGRVEVTGSLIKRENFTSTSPMQVIDAESQFKAGQLSVADMLQQSTVAAGTTQLNNQFSGFVIQGGTGNETLDLRGLGADRTLVLINGRRPGASGTRGQTGPFDLNAIPDIAVTRLDIVLDGSSSIYGSDAIAGVANIITRRSVDDTELTATIESPFESGGEFYRIGAITGMNFDKGSVMLSAQWDKQEELTIGDRSFLECPQDMYWGTDGQRIDRENRSPVDLSDNGFGCNNLYFNTVLDATGQWGRLVPTADGSTVGPLPGYAPRYSGRYDVDGAAWFEDVLDAEFLRSERAINERERTNIYATADYSFDFWGGVDWDAEFLWSNRQTTAEGWRQFFPVVYGAAVGFPYPDDPTYNPPVFGQPVMPYPSNYSADIDFYYFTTGLEGVLPTSNYWSWQAYASYSYSDGSYTNNAILNSQSGDIRFDTSPPRVDYFSPGILSGEDMQSLIDAVGRDVTGSTVYDQFQATAILSGELFQMPAGYLASAFGIEYRSFSIDDQPSQESQDSELWGSTSALVTKGTNDVIEAFGELDIPLLAGMTGFESLDLNVSARAFDYKDGGSDWVWKAGLNWQVTPSIRLRTTAGTSYRAPSLYQLYLGDETSFTDQLAIDPCIDWINSTNDNIRANCAAEGIPQDYTGFPSSSALVYTGGGAGNLNPETSDSFTVGFVWTPEFTDLNVSVDYYETTVNDQISSLGAGGIVAGCYSGDNFPNAFCDLFTRVPGSDLNRPFNIDEVYDQFVNIDKQTLDGVDVTATWSGDFDFGTIRLEGNSSFYLENVYEVFAPGSVQGFDVTDVVGSVGSPDNVSNFRANLDRHDWTFTYFLQYVSETDQSDFADEITTYFGYENARQDITMDAALYHNFSIFYEQDKWDLLVGINNLFDEEPDMVSSGAGLGLRGNWPVAASQYDLLGRRLYVRLNWRL